MNEDFSILDLQNSITSVQGRLETVSFLLDNYFYITDEDSAFDRINSMRFIELLSEQVHESSKRLSLIVDKSASLRLRRQEEPVAD